MKHAVLAPLLVLAAALSAHAEAKIFTLELSFDRKGRTFNTELAVRESGPPTTVKPPWGRTRWWITVTPKGLKGGKLQLELKARHLRHKKKSLYSNFTLTTQVDIHQRAFGRDAAKRAAAFKATKTVKDANGSKPVKIGWTCYMLPHQAPPPGSAAATEPRPDPKTFRIFQATAKGTTRGSKPLKLDGAALEWQIGNRVGGQNDGWGGFLRLKNTKPAWEAAPTSYTDLYQVVPKDMDRTFAGGADAAAAQRVFGKRWSNFGSTVRVLAYEVILVRRVDQPKTVFALRFQEWRNNTVSCGYRKLVRK